MRLTLEFNALVRFDMTNLSILVLIPRCKQQKVFIRCMLAGIQLCVSSVRRRMNEGKGKICAYFLGVFLKLPFAELSLTWHYTERCKTLTHLPRCLIHPSLRTHSTPAGRYLLPGDVRTSIWPWKMCVRLHAFVSWIGPQAAIHYSCDVSDSIGWY